MHGENLLLVIVTLLAAATAALSACVRLGVSSAVGYLLVGVLVGPHALGVVPASPATDFLAELGVAFLMFTVGLEFSLPRILAERRTFFGFGAAQVAVTALVPCCAALARGSDAPAALTLGGAIAMSSTALGTKELARHGALASPFGRMAVGALLFQDLATVPFLTVVSAGTAGTATGTGPGGFLAPLLGGLLRAAGVFAAFLVLGRWAFTAAIARVIRTGSAELRMLSVLLLLFGAGAVAQAAGLSLPLGAFMVGMILGETDFRAEVEADIRPFQAALLGLFFVNVGMALDPRAALLHRGPLVLLLLAALVPAKAAAISLLARLSGADGATAFRTGLVLAHGGEFGLLLASLALRGRVLGEGTGQALLAAIVLSMLLAPPLIQAAAAASGPRRRRRRRRTRHRRRPWPRGGAVEGGREAAETGPASGGTHPRLA